MSSLSNRLRRLALREVEKLESLVGADYWCVVPADIFWRFEKFFTVHPQRRATRRDAAVHEAGHFVLYEACGLWAYEAGIQCYGGWYGGTRYGDRPGFARPPDCDAEDFLRLAQAAIGGPLAEDRLGGRDVLNSIGDLAEARIFAQRAAELSNGDKTETWREVVLRADTLVERHTHVIKDIAERFECRKHIDRSEPSVDKIMGRMRPATVGPITASDRAFEILQEITDAMKEFGL